MSREPKGDGTYHALAAAILTAHQRHRGGCLCGRLELGERWSHHVADVLASAGALREFPPTKPEQCACGQPRSDQ